MLCENVEGYQYVKYIEVLILVLMEDALREEYTKAVFHLEGCLNPCSNGRCSARDQILLLGEEMRRS